jgi:hypothetical protein
MCIEIWSIKIVNATLTCPSCYDSVEMCDPSSDKTVPVSVF